MMKDSALKGIILFSCLLASAFLYGNDKTIIIPKTDSKVIVDGVLNDSCWGKTEELDDFFLLGTDKISDVKTKVRLCRDNTWLYVAFECEEPEAEKLKNRKISNTYRVVFLRILVHFWMTRV